MHQTPVEPSGSQFLTQFLDHGTVIATSEAIFHHYKAIFFLCSSRMSVIVSQKRLLGV